MVRQPSTGQNLLMEGADLLNGGTGTAVSQLSEAGQEYHIVCCAKEVKKKIKKTKGPKKDSYYSRPCVSGPVKDEVEKRKRGG
jgi:hypothetical protein